MRNTRVYKIWLMLLENPGKWYHTDDIAYDLDLTRKQLYAMLAKFPTPPVEKDRTDGCYGFRVRVCGSEQYLEKVKEAIMRDMYNLSDELIQEIHDALPIAGWISLSDLSQDTGYSMTQLSRVISLLDDIDFKSLQGIPLYKRAEGESSV